MSNIRTPLVKNVKPKSSIETVAHTIDKINQSIREHYKKNHIF